MNFEIHLSGKVSKFLKNADKELYKRIVEKLKKLGEDPFSQDAKRIIGYKEKIFRVRVGDYRILYVVFMDKKTILIANIDKRAKIYQR